jgi:hypothetical protein
MTVQLILLDLIALKCEVPYCAVISNLLHKWPQNTSAIKLQLICMPPSIF